MNLMHDKMTRKQYLEAGELEMNKKVDNDPSQAIKKDYNDLVENMQSNDEISEKISDFLSDG